MDKELNNEQEVELTHKLHQKLLEIMNESPEGTYDNITDEEEENQIESLTERYPEIDLVPDPRFSFWGSLFLLGYDNFSIDFLDKVLKRDPAEIKAMFRGIYDLYINKDIYFMDKELDFLSGIIAEYDAGNIDSMMQFYKKLLKNNEDNEEQETDNKEIVNNENKVNNKEENI